MASWGFTLIIIGIGSFLLNMAGMEFMLLAWVDNWGSTVGTAIRVGVAVLGAAMIGIDFARKKGQAAS